MSRPPGSLLQVLGRGSYQLVKLGLSPSNRTLPGTADSQDLKPHDSGTPQIIAPERRYLGIRRYSELKSILTG
jgi:hypothetical protein